MKRICAVMLVGMAVVGARAASWSSFAWATNGSVPQALNIPVSNNLRMLPWFDNEFPFINSVIFANSTGIVSQVEFSDAFDSFMTGINLGETDWELLGTNMFFSARASTNVAILQFALTGSPFSTATYVETHRVGANNHTPRGMTKTAAGGLFVFWSDLSTANTNVSSGVAYRDTSGTWHDTFPIDVSSTGSTPGSGTSYATAVHPADGKVWNFFINDAGTTIHAINCVETGGDPTITAIGQFIDSSAGDDSAEGEIPQLRAVADPASNTIRLAYQSKQYHIFSVDPFLKGAYMRVAGVAADGSTTFVPFDVYIERTSPFGFDVVGGQPVILFQPISAAGISQDLYLAAYNGSLWPTSLMATATAGAGLWSMQGAGMTFGYTNGTRSVLVQSALLPPSALRIGAAVVGTLRVNR